MTTETTIIKNWKEIPFSECLQKVKVGREKQVKERGYSKDGLYPIVDQGQSFIAGYTNDKNKVISDIQPFIIFGDHTRILKYIDFPIALGADGTKVIKPKNDFDTKFFFYFLKYLDIPSRGYNRHFTILKEKIVSQPSLAEQKSIARVLTIIQEAIARQEELITTLKDLKQSMMQQLFSHGTKGEKTKITEIGKIPRSWEVVGLGEVCKFTRGPFGGSLKKDIFVKDGVAIYEQSHAIHGDLKTFRYFIDDKKFEEMKRFEVEEGDLIMSCSGTFGKIQIIPRNHKKGIINQALLKLKPVKTSSFFLKLTLESPVFKNQLKSSILGVAVQNVASVNVLKNLKIALPPKVEQLKIENAITAVDSKIEINGEKLSIYQNLFKTLLHELLSGQRRVKLLL